MNIANMFISDYEDRYLLLYLIYLLHYR